MLACTYASTCSGCDWLEKPLEEQRALKISHLRSVWEPATGRSLPDVGFISIAEGGLRDRADLMIDRRSGEARLGLFDRARSGIVDLAACPQMSPALEAWLADFRRVPIPVERGSVRLRVSPNGQRGVWLDLANIDVKRLLDERMTLDQLLAMNAVVEIGQRRKRLEEREGRLKLGDPRLESWFETELPDGRRIPLYCAIGSFTQPGFAANLALIREVRAQIGATRARRAFEFGAGIGNFTLPLAALADEVEVFEVDRLALEGLERSLAEANLKVKIHAGNFQAARAVEFADVDLVLVDPPRSGLMHFLDPLAQLSPEVRPAAFVYVSCFAESFATDSKRLYDLGYRLERIAIVDQFPQSRHYETVATFQR